MKWLRSKGCGWSMSTCTSSAAATNGYLEILKWLKDNRCPPFTGGRNSPKGNEYICSSAAMSGHLEVLKWARVNGCRWNWETCKVAAENGHLEILKWLRSNGCGWNENTCSAAAK